MKTLKVLDRTYEKDGDLFLRTTRIQEIASVVELETLAKDESDVSVSRMLPDHEKCPLCRAGRDHTIYVHEDMVENWYRNLETGVGMVQLRETSQQQVDALWRMGVEECVNSW